MGNTARKSVSVGFVLIAGLALALPAQAQVELDLTGVTGVVREPAESGAASAGQALETLSLPAIHEAAPAREPEAAPAQEPEAAVPGYSLIRVEGETLADDQRAQEYGLALGKSRSNAGIETMAELANAYLNLPEDRGVKPYIGGGIGYAIVTVDRFGTLDFDPLDASGGLLAYQLRAGFVVGVLPHTQITLGYRYFVTEDLNVTIGSSDRGRIYEYDAHVGELGVRIEF